MPLALQAGNPHIIVTGDPPNPTVIFSNNFGFGADNAGGGVFSFQNESGQNWLELTITANFATPNVSFTVGPGPFLTDTVSYASDPAGGYLYSIIFGPTTSGGIANGEIFSINLNDTGTDENGVGSWGPSKDFGGAANATPEPSTAMLGAAGIFLLGGAIWRQRRASAA